MDRLKDAGVFGEVQTDVALEGQDDRLVGVVKKTNKQSNAQNKTGFAMG